MHFECGLFVLYRPLVRRQRRLCCNMKFAGFPLVCAWRRHILPHRVDITDRPSFKLSINGSVVNSKFVGNKTSLQQGRLFSVQLLEPTAFPSFFPFPFSYLPHFVVSFPGDFCKI